MNKPKLKHKRKIVLLTIFLLACGIAISALGKKINPPFSFYMIMDNISNICTNLDNQDENPNDNIGAIIDQQGKRFSLINNDQIVYKQMYFDNKNTHINQAKNAYVFKDQIFVLGYMLNESQSYETKNKVCLYDSNGNFVQDIYSVDLNVEDEDDESILTIYKKEEDIYIVTNIGNKLFIKKVNYLNEAEKKYDSDNISVVSYLPTNKLIIDAEYRPSNDTLMLIDYLGKSYIWNSDNILSEINLNNVFDDCHREHNTQFKINYYGDEEWNSHIYVSDLNDNTIEELDIVDTNAHIDFENHKIYYTDHDNNIYIIDYLKGQINKFSTLYYDFWILLYQNLIWISLSVIVIICLVFAGIFLYKRRNVNLTKHWKYITLISIILVFTGVSIYANQVFYNIEKETLATRICALSNYLSENEEINLDNLNKKTFANDVVGDEQAKINRDEFSIYYESAWTLTEKFNINEANTTFNIYSINSQKTHLLNLAGTHKLTAIGIENKIVTPEDISDILNNKNVFGSATDENNSFMYSLMPIYNPSGKIIGAIEIRTSINSLNTIHFELFKDSIIMIIIFTIVLMLLFTTINNVRISLNKYRKSLKSKLVHKEVYLVETMEFLKNFLASIDAVLCVLITKEMLSSMGIDNNGVLIGLPAFSWGIGSILISALFPRIKKSLSIKQIYFIYSFFLLASMIGMAFSIFVNSYLLYIITKFIFGIGFGLLYASNYTIPMCVEDKDIRYDSLRRLSLTEVSAPILAVMLCGYIGDMLGNHTIYIVGAFAVGIIFLITSLYMPNNLHFKTNEKSSNKIKTSKLLKFLMSPEIIICFILCIVLLCVGAYKTYLFPLYTNDLNVSNVEISNYFVIASALVLLFSPVLDRLTKNFNSWNNVIYLLAVLGIIFILFLTNSTLLWAIIVFFLSCILQKNLNTEWKSLWPRKCVKEKIDPAQIQPYFSVADSIGLLSRPIILGLLLSFGSNWACIALGVILLIVTSLFYLFTKNTSLK